MDPELEKQDYWLRKIEATARYRHATWDAATTEQLDSRQAADLLVAYSGQAQRLLSQLAAAKYRIRELERELSRERSR